jgi:hypothetical protein
LCIYVPVDRTVDRALVRPVVGLDETSGSKNFKASFAGKISDAIVPHSAGACETHIADASTGSSVD